MTHATAHIARLAALAWIAAAAAPAARAADPDTWAGYLDYAFVYVSAEPDALAARLEGYGREAGMPLARYLEGLSAQTARGDAGDASEAALRRRAIGLLLQYLASGEPEWLEASAEAIEALDGRLGRHENRYWYRTIRAQRALEKGRRFEFVGELLDLWREVVVPLEAPYETLQTLALGDSPSSGFVAALPYVYENVARLILIRSQQMGVDRDLDPLAALVRLLHDGRVGGQPEVIPPSASSRAYLERVVERLDGPESDAGSLSFTLALFEATRLHERARSLLASEGFSAETLRAVRVATGAYERALERADTVQGQCAVYTRVLRQLGELYAARQRLGGELEIESPFSIEGAIEVYAALHRGGVEGIEELGYGATGSQSYLDAMQALWEEIQEATLNTAEYYLARSLDDRLRAAEHARGAARIFSRYLAFFDEFATGAEGKAVPDSAYFAAYEAAKGYGDALLGFGAASPTPAEVDQAVRRYHAALRLFPFDRQLWPALTEALAREGRENEYLRLVQPIAQSLTRSRYVDAWIEQGEPGARQIESLRRALGDTLVIMHLGFADAAGIAELERSLHALRERRAAVEARIAALGGAPGAGGAPPASPAPDGALAALARADQRRELAEATALLERFDRQIAARSRALPLYKAAVADNGLAAELRARRDHPGHTLLRRLYHENHS